MNKEILEKLYLEENKTTREIAIIYGISKSTVLYWLEKFNIPKRKSGRFSKNIKDEKFGNLFVIEKKIDKWKCLCDCGNILYVNFTSLKNGQKSCWDCRNTKISNLRWQGYGEISKDFFTKNKKSAEARNLKFDVTIEYLWELFLKQNRRCALSNLELTFARRKKRSDITASIDRIDSNKGYTEENIQWVHKDINLMKNDLNQTDFIKYCKLISNNF